MAGSWTPGARVPAGIYGRASFAMRMKDEALRDWRAEAQRRFPRPAGSRRSQGALPWVDSLHLAENCGLTLNDTSGDEQDANAVFCRFTIHGFYAQMDGEAVSALHFFGISTVTNGVAELSFK